LTEQSGQLPARNTVEDERIERWRATILHNELVSGDEDIAAKILEVGKMKAFKKGDKFIKQDAQDDEVYFIVSGSSVVYRGSRLIASRTAPFTVGELAAIRPGLGRTADVIVRSEILETIIVSGSNFRYLMRNFPSFTAKAYNLEGAMLREKIPQLDKEWGTKEISWTAISGIVGFLCSLSGLTFAYFSDFSAQQLILSTIIAGLIGFVAILKLNPNFLYRNMASSSAGVLFILLLYGGMSVAITIDGQPFDLPLVDFSVNTEVKLTALAIGVIALLVLIFLAGRLDLKLNKMQKED